MVTPWSTRTVRCARSFVAVLVLISVVFSAFGVAPSPATIARWAGIVVNTVERYPCESCGCGCAGASECWSACCCNTPQERLVWALRRGVMPPPVARFSESQWIAAANIVKPGSATCGACVARIQVGLRNGIALAQASSSEESAAKACCAKPASSGVESDCAVPKLSGKRPDRASESHGACISALGCKGLMPVILIAFVPAMTTTVTIMIVPSGEPAPTRSGWPEQFGRTNRALDIASPPPRL